MVSAILLKSVNNVSPAAIKKLLSEYASDYKMTKAVANSETLKEAARIETRNGRIPQGRKFQGFHNNF